MSVNITDDNFKESIAKGIVLVDFWAEWCSPCRALSPTIDKLSEKYSDSITVAKIDIDQSPNTSTLYGIRSIPTVLIFKDGEVIDKLVGPKSDHEYSKIIDSLIHA